MSPGHLGGSFMTAFNSGALTSGRVFSEHQEIAKYAYFGLMESRTRKRFSFSAYIRPTSQFHSKVQPRPLRGRG